MSGIQVDIRAYSRRTNKEVSPILGMMLILVALCECSDGEKRQNNSTEFRHNVVYFVMDWTLDPLIKLMRNSAEATAAVTVVLFEVDANSIVQSKN